MPQDEMILLLLPKVPSTQEENTERITQFHFFFVKTKMSFTVQQLLLTGRNLPVEGRGKGEQDPA